MIFRSIFLFLCFLSPLIGSEPIYYLSVCAIFRNEARFLKEWIEYHRLMGVEHFYLFNNLSEDQYLTVLDPYIEENLVELIDWPYKPQEHKNWIDVQCRAYNTLIDNRGRDSFWMAIIDIDEFIVPVEAKNIPKFLVDYEEFGGLAINCQHYGTSDVLRIGSDQTLIGTLTMKAPTNDPSNFFVKTIFQPKKLSKIRKPHGCKYKKGFFSVTESKQPLEESQSHTETLSVEKIRINHYLYRDEEFFYTEKVRRNQEWFPSHPPLTMNPKYNQVEDPILIPIAKQLEERITTSSPYHTASR